MTTATKRKLTASERRDELHRALEAARIERNAVRQRATEHRSRVHGLRSALFARQLDHDEEFSATGQPKKGTEAANLASEIHKLAEADGFDNLIQAAEQRLAQAERAGKVDGRETARQLLIELAGENREAVQAFVEWAAAGSEHLARLAGLQHRASAICTESRSFDPRTIPNLDHWVSLVRALTTGAPSLQLPREIVAELETEDD